MEEKRHMRRTTRSISTLAVLGLALGVTACGGGSSSGAGSGGGAGGGAGAPSFAKDFKPPTSGCGSFAVPMPADPEGAISQLDAEHQAVYAGYFNFPDAGGKMLKSAWADWKPNHPPPYDVLISWSTTSLPWNNAAVTAMERFLRASPLIGDVTVNTTAAIDLGQQINQFNAGLRKNPDIVLLQPTSPEAFLQYTDKAGEAGIPVITLPGYSVSKYVVSVDTNTYLEQGIVASYVSRLLGGKGNIMKSQGLAGSTTDRAAEGAWDEVIKGCPGMKAGKDKIYTGFLASAAKAEALKYLGTHPAKVDAVFDAALGATGIMQAFQQSGRPMPIVTDNGLMKGSLGYWRQNRDKYHSIGQFPVPVADARASVEVALRMLSGQGIKLNHVLGRAPVVTDANLDDWADPKWTLQTPGVTLGAEDALLPSDYLDDFFNKPAPLAK
jgi:ribose transport system substrate-binding protein